MDRDQANQLWAEVTTNNRRLNECSRHLFVDPLPPIERRFQAKIKCQHCGGSMRLTDLNQYIRGYEAAGKSGNDIWPGWKS